MDEISKDEISKIEDLFLKQFKFLTKVQKKNWAPGRALVWSDPFGARQ